MESVTMNERINVTKSFLPPFDEYENYIKQIWESGQLTNQGTLVKDFEKQLSIYLDVDNFHFVTNGTIALQIALKALDITEGEVITTPFSYVATTSAILWERCTPVFVDIESDTFCIDADKIEASITPDTKAIMAVHVFGNPCDVEKIDKIAKKHNLKVIYDDAHAFGVKYKGKSLLDYGDASICSFHSTKVFHTIEGGCIIAKDNAVSDKIELIKKFGHNGDDHYRLGINAKASEFQAAMGLTNLKYFDGIIKDRKTAVQLYDVNIVGKKRYQHNSDVEQNYSYYPVVFKDEKTLLNVMKDMEKENIFPRRYFYPSLNTLPYITVQNSCPVSESISKRILCLPLFVDLAEKDILRICKVVNKYHVK